MVGEECGVIQWEQTLSLRESLQEEVCPAEVVENLHYF
jgi:hypothetical protein